MDGWKQCRGCRPGARSSVFLILDNLRVHHSQPVKAWLADRTHQIEVFYLPSYSPELNLEERLNADLKQAMGKRVPVRTMAKLRDAGNEHMAMLEKSPERVMIYFQDPSRRLRLHGAGSIARPGEQVLISANQGARGVKSYISADA